MLVTNFLLCRCFDFLLNNFDVAPVPHGTVIIVAPRDSDRELLLPYRTNAFTASRELSDLLVKRPKRLLEKGVIIGYAVKHPKKNCAIDAIRVFTADKFHEKLSRRAALVFNELDPHLRAWDVRRPPEQSAFGLLVERTLNHRMNGRYAHVAGSEDFPLTFRVRDDNL